MLCLIERRRKAMHISTHGFPKTWLGLCLLCACTTNPMGARPTDASMESALEVATDLPTFVLDLQASAPEVAKQACGNGKFDPGEGCDDGNTVSGDDCSSSCAVEDDWPPCGLGDCTNRTMCGNQVLTANETCDDGNTLSGDAPSDARNPTTAGMASLTWTGTKNVTLEIGTA